MNGEYPQNYDPDKGFTFPTFNTEDFTYLYGYVSQFDLLKYANLTKNNFFLGSYNYFQNLSAFNINGVDVNVFQYLVNISQDVQTSLNNIFNIFYDSVTKSTLVNNDLVAKNTSAMISLSSNNASISNLLNTYQINSSLINTNQINAQKIQSNNISCNNLQFSNDVGLYLYVPIIIPTYGSSSTSSLMLFPIIKSQIVSNLFTTTSFYYILFHIKPNYRVDILNTNMYVIYSFKNTTTDIIYNKNLTLSNVYKINLYLNNILLT
jgi:hypothetical protein